MAAHALLHVQRLYPELDQKLTFDSSLTTITSPTQPAQPLNSTSSHPIPPLSDPDQLAWIETTYGTPLGTTDPVARLHPHLLVVHSWFAPPVPLVVHPSPAHSAWCSFVQTRLWFTRPAAGTQRAHLSSPCPPSRDPPDRLAVAANRCRRGSRSSSLR